MRYLILSDVHANLEALEAVLEDGAVVDAGARAWRSGRVWRRSQRGGRLYSRPADCGNGARQSRQGGHRAGAGGQLQPGRAPCDRLDDARAHAREPRLAGRAARGTDAARRARGDLPRGAARRGLLRVRRDGRAARVSRPDAAGVPLRAHARRLRVPDRAGHAAGPDPGGQCPTCSSTPPRARRSSTAAPSASRGTAIHAPPTASWTPPPAR